MCEWIWNPTQLYYAMYHFISIICIVVIHNLLGKAKFPLILQAVCTSCLNGVSMGFGQSIYTERVLLMHALLNFIVPGSTSCNNFLCSSEFLPHSIAHWITYAPALSSYIAPILQSESSSLPDSFMHGFNDPSGTTAVAAFVTDLTYFSFLTNYSRLSP